MYVLAVLDIPEPLAADEIVRAAQAGVPVRRRLRAATARIIARQPQAVRVVAATLDQRRDPALLDAITRRATRTPTEQPQGAPA